MFFLFSITVLKPSKKGPSALAEEKDYGFWSFWQEPVSKMKSPLARSNAIRENAFSQSVLKKSPFLVDLARARLKTEIALEALYMKTHPSRRFKENFGVLKKSPVLVVLARACLKTEIGLQMHHVKTLAFVASESNAIFFSRF